MPARFCRAFEALSAPNRDVIPELAFEARVPFTWPSVDAVRLSLTTIMTTS